METRSKATRDLALSDDVNPSAEFPARMGESTPASGDLGYIGAAGIVGDSRPSSTRPPTEVVSPHMSIHEGDVDGPPLLQRADLAPISSSSINPCPLHWFLVNWGSVDTIEARPQVLITLGIIILVMSVLIIC